MLAGLALSTDEYVELMIFKNGKPSEFYQSYVRDVQAKITENAAAEFQCIWREHARLAGAKTRTLISDELSGTLNTLQAELEGSDLFEDEPSRRGVMRRAIPKTLVEQVGLDELLRRLPEPYQRALFSSWVASHFVSPRPHFAPFLALGADVFLADLQVRRERLERRLLPFRARPCELIRFLCRFLFHRRWDLVPVLSYKCNKIIELAEELFVDLTIRTV